MPFTHTRAHRLPTSQKKWSATSTLRGVIFSKSVIFGSVGIQEDQRIHRDISSFQDLEIFEDIYKGDLLEVNLGERLHRLHIRLSCGTAGTVTMIGVTFRRGEQARHNQTHH